MYKVIRSDGVIYPCNSLYELLIFSEELITKRYTNIKHKAWIFPEANQYSYKASPINGQFNPEWAAVLAYELEQIKIKVAKETGLKLKNEPHYCNIIEFKRK